MEDADFTQGVRLAISRRDGQLLERCVDSFASLCFKGNRVEANTIAPEVFDFIVEQIHDRCFQEMTGSWHLLHLFETDWGRLTSEQKDKLMVCLEATFERFTDSMACFITAELLGEYYSNERAFELLDRLSFAKAEVPRSMVPMGLEYLARSPSEPLSKRAVDRLTEMRTDESPLVRTEVEEGLQKIVRRRQLETETK
jgi:hypothetical protein